MLVGFHKESKSGADQWKYFITGSVASGVGLYGLSLLYLEFSSLQLHEIAAHWSESSVLGLIALGLVLVGFGFKVSAAPFHFAAPDAYAGANSQLLVFSNSIQGNGYDWIDQSIAGNYFENR